MLRTALRPLLRRPLRPLWRYHAVMAPGRGVPGNPGPSSSSLNPHSSEAATKSSAVSGGGTSSGAQGAQMSESSKHPYDPGPGTTDIPRGALKDPAAGPNSRPEMEASVASGGASGSESGSGTSSPSAGAAGSTSAGPGVGTGPNLSSSGAANSGSESTTTTASTATPPSAADLDHARDPVRGPSSMPAAATSDDVRDPVRGPSSSPHPAATPPPVEETEPEPAPSPLTASPRSRHPFDTYAFVSRLEKSDIDSGSARALMEGVRRLIVSRSDEARGTMLSTEEMDNAAYRFKAAVSELRTEQSVRTRNDGVAMRSAASAMRREVDALEQQMKVDLQGLRHDIDLDLNNRKTDNRSDMTRFDMATEEINNKFTISLGDLRTEIESSKWDATRRAISIIAMLVIGGIALSTFSIPAKLPPAPAPPVIMRDIGVGLDERHFDDHLDDHDNHDQAHRVEQHLDALLQDRGWREREKEKERAEGSRRDRQVDRDTASSPRYHTERI